MVHILHLLGSNAEKFLNILIILALFFNQIIDIETWINKQYQLLHTEQI